MSLRTQVGRCRANMVKCQLDSKSLYLLTPHTKYVSHARVPTMSGQLLPQRPAEGNRKGHIGDYLLTAKEI